MGRTIARHHTTANNEHHMSNAIQLQPTVSSAEHAPAAAAADNVAITTPPVWPPAAAAAPQTWTWRRSLEGFNEYQRAEVEHAMRAAGASPDTAELWSIDAPGVRQRNEIRLRNGTRISFAFSHCCCTSMFSCTSAPTPDRKG